MQRPRTLLKRSGFALAACIAGALFAQGALANCPPGMHPSGASDRAHPAKCVPDRTPTRRSNVRLPSGVRLQAGKPHTPTPKQRDWRKAGPSVGPGPVEHAAKANPHAIIFTGGKNAINSQPVPPGHATLNPQPISPGHVRRQPPRSAGASQKMRRDARAYKES